MSKMSPPFLFQQGPGPIYVLVHLIGFTLGFMLACRILGFKEGKEVASFKNASIGGQKRGCRGKVGNECDRTENRALR